jgi:hypothetical protein
MFFAMSKLRPVPSTLAAIMEQWRTAGSGSQRPIPWSRRTWIATLPEYEAFLESVPDTVDREEATKHAAAVIDDSSAEAAFIAAMIWGYGRIGYGAYRARRVLLLNPEAGSRLAETARVARDHGPISAFQTLRDARLKYLGVAFGTKYLYFCTRAVRDRHGDRTAPILDTVVRQWLVTHADLRLRLNGWYEDEYVEYLGALSDWSAQLALPMDTIEELIFRSQIGRWPTPSSDEMLDAVGGPGTARNNDHGIAK